MSYKTETSADGTRRLVNNTTGKTVQAFGAGGTARELTAAVTLTPEENGMTFYLNASTEFATTLPLPFLGACYEFIVKTAPSGANYTVVTNGSANIIKGTQYSSAGDAGDSGTSDDTISFVSAQSVAGDRVLLKSDGTSWFAWAFSDVAAGITFTTAG